jgi:DNA-directed RNA polymerase subunit M/transcription elongation factor TFIIS
MPEPQIARRCPKCGASIREVALFCPQCGNALPPRNASQSQSPVTSKPDEVNRRDTAPLDDAEVQSQRDFSDTVAIQRSETRDEPRSIPNPPAIDKAGERPIDPARPRARGVVGTKIQRATTMARGVEGDVLQRVQKVRDISSVVFDEAAYDPSLRFVLVAAIVFGLFLVIVLLNRFIT